MKLYYVIGSVLIICLLLLGTIYVISRNQNDVPGSNAQNYTPIKTGNISITNYTDTANNTMGGSSIATVTAIPANEPTVDNTIVAQSGNGQINTVCYCLQYGTDKYVTDANVAMYTIISYNQSTQDHDLKIVDIPGNPLNATNVLVRGTPVYQFNDVPYGIYIIRAEKDGKRLASGPYSVTGAGGVFIAIVDNPNSKIPDTCHLDKNTIYGWVKSLRGDNLANVKVSLMMQQSHADTPKLTTNIENNPTFSYDGEYTGFYCFENVTPGWYTIMIDYQDRSYTNTFNFSGNDEGGSRSDQTFYYMINSESGGS